ncbi:histidine phosphatase family protein [Nostoc sp. 'Lobaria pulmonaria (5183) cyanobiont']|uniref:histidine phosphatase family protein n=1 Tax=Nostoc sp. 'Lobaria pulmonaria (5183) cyanobiont' TaxID=1618022 RepID=UPI000CF31AA2|nr:histidine phosphatase family protein [Nostoc sp. 'Lobaria pulmonaria (5183) cyanobiont']AVH69444.1 phosphoglycerate mutase [Nostoc sp. 'Lobaria pulmonaria (5183) cyanobiont']
MTLNLYLLRHGETTFSQSGNFCGKTDAQLTSEGIQMAESFADVYQSLLWEAVYVSPMKRAIATAKPFCDAIGMNMQLRDGLREGSYGSWETLSKSFVQENYAQNYVKWLTEPAWNAPIGGETAVDIANRSMPVIAEIQEKHPQGNVLVVSHKATIRILLCSLLGIDLGRYRYRVNILVASVSMVKFDVNGPLLEILGDRHHIPDRIRSRPGT